MLRQFIHLMIQMSCVTTTPRGTAELVYMTHFGSTMVAAVDLVGAMTPLSLSSDANTEKTKHLLNHD